MTTWELRWQFNVCNLLDTSLFSLSSSSWLSLALRLQCSATTCKAWYLRSSSPPTAFPPSFRTSRRKEKQKANAGAQRSSVIECDVLGPLGGTVRVWRMDKTRLVEVRRFSSHQAEEILHIGLRSLSVTYATMSAGDKSIQYSLAKSYRKVDNSVQTSYCGKWLHNRYYY